MQVKYLVLLLIVASCATAPQQVHRGFAVVERGVKGVDVGLHLALEAYEAAYETNEALCRGKFGDTSTVETRDECTKAFRNADKIAQDAKQAAELYDELVDVLQKLEPIVERLVTEAERVRQ